MMQPGEVAWIAREYVRGRRQIEIAHEIGFTTSVQVCLAIREFCDDWSGADVEALHAYGNSRRYFLRKALRNYAAVSSSARSSGRCCRMRSIWHKHGHATSTRGCYGPKG